MKSQHLPVARRGKWIDRGRMEGKRETWNLISGLIAPVFLLPASAPEDGPSARKQGSREGSRKAPASSLRESIAVQMSGFSPFSAVNAQGTASARRRARWDRHQDRAGAAITSVGGS